MSRGNRLRALLIAAVAALLVAGPARADVVVIGGPVDNTAPTMVSIDSVSPTSVDTTNGAATATFTVHATDDLSGVANLAVRMRNQRTGNTTWGSGGSWTRQTGTANDGTFNIFVTFYPNTDMAGRWILDGCSASDVVGNSTVDPTGAGSGYVPCPTNDIKIDVIGGPVDNTAPTMVSIDSVSPTSVDTTNGAATATFTVHATDDLSGVANLAVRMRNQRTGNTTWGSGGSWTRQTGTANDGTFNIFVTFYPNTDMAGRWILDGCSASDVVGNSTVDPTGAGSGYVPCPTNDIKIDVIGGPVDNTAPTMVSIDSVSPTSVDTTNGAATATFTVHATDDLSGVANLAVRMRNQRTGNTTWGSGGSWTRQTGTANDGTFNIFVTFYPNTDMAGRWILDGCSASDVVGNSTVDPTGAGSGYVPCPTNDIKIGVETPPTTGAAGDTAELSLSNSASPAEALPGDTVTYTLTATNGSGAGDATGTAVTDVLPEGVTFLDASEGCTNDAGTVRCELGTIPAGGSKTATIRATVDAMPMRPDPNTAHQVLEQKAETDLRVEHGETKTATATCPSGYFATDGGIRLDAVDQGGDVAKTHVSASGATADGTGWIATLSNDNPGAALAKVTVACLARTTVTGAHQHDLVTSTATAADQPLPAGANTVTVDCAPGQTPYAPSYDLTTGGLVTASRADGSSWRFDVTAPSAGTGDFAVGCLDPRTTSAAGHYHVLGIEQRSQTVTVPAGQTIETQLTCADEAKGIVASRRVDAGLVDRGTDPRAKIRSFRFTNPTDHALTADLGLTCLDIRTSGEPVSARIANTATVSTTAPDATTADDSATATFTAYGDGWAILPTATATVARAGRSVSVPLRCASDCAVSARVTSLRGTTLGTGRASLAAGSTTRLTVRTTKAGAQAIARHRVTQAKVVVRTSDGTTYTRVVRLR